MTEPDFRDLVLKMRESQTRYFKNRTPEALRGAKDYERRVDTELAGGPGAPLFGRDKEEEYR